MSEVCEVCQRPLCVAQLMGGYEEQRRCYRLGYERTLARADRYQAEFAACKALLIAAQQRGERAEAERAAAEELYVVACRDFREARALALREAEQAIIRWGDESEHASGNDVTELCERIRALAALPVEPARRQVAENANALGAPAAGCSEEER